MVVEVIIGRRHAVNQHIVFLAHEWAPSLLVDCANSADPHLLARKLSPEVLDDISVLEVELLYSFRDILLALLQNEPKKIFITTFHRLFHYQDEIENVHLYEQSWLLIQRLGVKHHLTVGMVPGSLQESLARTYHGGTQWVTLS